MCVIKFLIVLGVYLGNNLILIVFLFVIILIKFLFLVIFFVNCGNFNVFKLILLVVVFFVVDVFFEFLVDELGEVVLFVE